MKDVTKQLRHRYTIQWMKTFKFVLVEKLYAEQSKAKNNFEFKLWNMCQIWHDKQYADYKARLKKKTIKIKRGPKKHQFWGLKTWGQGGPGP